MPSSKLGQYLVIPQSNDRGELQERWSKSIKVHLSQSSSYYTDTRNTVKSRGNLMTNELHKCALMPRSANALSAKDHTGKAPGERYNCSEEEEEEEEERERIEAKARRNAADNARHEGLITQPIILSFLLRHPAAAPCHRVAPRSASF